MASGSALCASLASLQPSRPQASSFFTAVSQVRLWCAFAQTDLGGRAGPAVSPNGSVSFNGSSPVNAYGWPVSATSGSTLRNWSFVGS
jgi:hypothetical protein